MTDSPVRLHSRREILARTGLGIGALGLAGLVAEPQKATAAESMTARQPHFPARAKHVIHIFLNGGASQVDTFDPKPELAKWEGKSLPGPSLKTERNTGAAFPSPFKFRQYGESGLAFSELFAELGEVADEIAVVRSMTAEVPNHEPSLLLMNCGDGRLVRPCVGSWVTYGLGTENQNLPGFIAMCPGGYPTGQSFNWRSAFLPGAFQGTHIDPNHNDIERLIANIRNAKLPADRQRRQLDFLQRLNDIHRAERPEEAALDARIESFELAYRMQSEAAEAFDFRSEPEHIQREYGDSVQARQILIARRLVERGVRYVQLYHGQGQPWDHHENLVEQHPVLARQCAPAIAALIRDLKRLGLLEETLVVVGGEFGRTPVVEMPTAGVNSGKVNGRDHNHYGFSILLAGGGIKGGTVYGATDEFGFRAVEDPVSVHDLHATMLHCLGFDHERLTYRYAGRDFRLTDVHGRVVREILA